MKWFLSVALSFVLAFMSVPALALESDDAENAPADTPSEETVPDGISDTAAPPTSETVPSAVEAVSEVAPEVAETASSATGATVVDRELGDFTVHAEAWYQDEQGQLANDEDRLARTLSFVADDGSQGGPGTLVIGADADAVTGEESYTISLKEGVASTSDSIEVRTRAFGSAYADDVYVVLDRVALNTTGRQASPLRIAESAGKVNLSLNGSNTLEGAHGFAGIQKDNGVDATLSLHGESDTALKAKGGFGSAGIGGGFAQGEDSLVGGIVLSSYGTIEAEGGDGAAGIGSGSSKDEGQSHATDITVESGTVRATGGLFGAGIGSGSSEEGGSHADGVTIAGGTVYAQGGDNAPGIGSGCSQKAESIAAHIDVTGGSVVAQGGETAAGIGSGWGYGYSSATNFTVSYGSVQATGGAGAPGIGSGYCHVSDSVAANIVLSGGDVIAQGGDSKRAEIGGQEQVIGAGAGIGSGWSEEADSFCNAVALSGARVTAKAGADTAAAGGAAGIGSGSALAGASRMENFVLSAGTLEAMGSATTLAGSQPQTLPAIGPGMAQARAMAGNSLAPAEGLCANAWKGATAEAAASVLTARVEPFAIDETAWATRTCTCSWCLRRSSR